ncbi:MAG: TldD/PmbA family protein [Actinomycetota bacterium]
MSDSDLLELTRGVAGAARPGEEVEAYALRTRETDIEIFGGEVESLTTAGIEGIGIRVIVDHCQGYASAGSLDPGVVEETLQEARDNAAFGAPDEWYGLATPNDVDGAIPAPLDLWRDDVVVTPADEKVRLALDVERATKARDTRVRGVEAAGYGDAASETALANSHGVESCNRRTTCSLYSVALADDGTGTQTGYGLSAGRAIADLNQDEVVGDAVDRACRLLGATPISGRRIAVVLDPLVTRSVLGVLSSAFNGESVLKGRSLFAGREGEKVAAPVVDIVDDPTDARAFGAARYDSEGIPTRRNPLIVDGVLHGFLHNVYTGRRAGVRTTGSAVRGGYGSAPGVGVRALVLRPGDRAPETVLASVPEAFYVQSVSGLHSGTNPISGDFSIGAEGLMVRTGVFAEPVREVTIASTLQRMLLDIAEVASDLTYLPGAATGATVLISEMTLSGA